MRLVAVHARAQTVELLRYPAYVVPTLLFPTVFYAFFAVPGTDEEATIRMAAFAAFATIGVAFFQFGVGIAVERASPWEAYVRTLPVGVATRLAARVASAAMFAALAAALVAAVGVAATDAHLPATGWVELALVLAAGTAPFALLGVALGYWAPHRGALPLANLLYLGLSYGGGLWFRPTALPHAVRSISPALPTRQVADLVGGVVYSTPWELAPWAKLGAYAVAFAALAAWGYRRDEGKRFA